MASKLEIILSAKNEASGPIGQVKAALGGLSGAASAAMMATAAAAAGAVTAVTASIGVGVNKAANLEQGVADIASVMGTTVEETKPLKDLIQNLGLDPNLKVDATGASNAIMQLAQSGIAMTDIVDGAAKSTVLLSNATGGDMALSAAIASDAMSLFGINAKDMANAVNGITGVTVASKFGIQDYQYALAAAGGVAASVGVNFDDFNTTIAAISPYFAGGSDAGTSFKTFLQRLVPSTDVAAGAMKELGLITEDGQNQFFDASGQMKSMADISGILANATAGLTEEQQNQYYSTIFGSDAMRAAFGIAKTGSSKFRDLAKNIGKVNAETAAVTRMNTLSGKLEILRGIIDGLLIKIGDAFLPLLRDLADWASEFVTKGGDYVVLWFEELARWVRNITPWLIDMGQRGFMFLGEAIKTVWPVLQTLAKYFIDILDGGTAWNGWLLKLPEWMIPVVRAIGELTDIVRGLFILFTQGDLQPFVAALQRAWYDIVNTATVVFFTIKNYVADHLPEWITTLQAWATALWKWITDVAPVVWKAIADTFNFIVKFVADNWQSWANTLATWGAALWGWIVDVAPTVGDWIYNVIDTIIKFFINNYSAYISTLASWGAALWGWISDVAPVVWNWITEIFGAVIGYVADNLPAWTKTLGEWATAVWAWITTDAGPKALDTIAKIFGAVIKFVSDNLPTWMSTLGEWARAAWTWITTDAGPKVIQWITTAFNAVVKFVGDNLPAWQANLSQWAGAAWQWISTDAGPKLWSAVSSAFTAVVTYISDNLPNWITNLRNWASAAWEWISTDGGPKAWAGVKGAFDAVVKFISDNLPAWKQNLSQWSTAAWQWISVDAAPKVKAELDKLWSGTIKPWLDTNGGGIGTAMEGWANRFLGFTGDIKKGWDTAWPEIEKIITDAADSITEDLGRIKASLGEIGGWFDSGEQTGWVISWATLWTTIVDVIAGAETYMIDAAANVVEAVNLIGQALKALSTGDMSGMGDILKRMSDMGYDMAQANLDRAAWVQSLFSREIFQKREMGGPVSAGSRYLVGEKGPELFVPKTSGTIVPNGAGTTVNNTYNVYVTGSGNAGRDVMQNVQMMQALYG